MSFYLNLIFCFSVTTVGYGDMAPVTPAGKLVGTATMFFGVLVIAFPVSVFTDKWRSYSTDDFSARTNSNSDGLSYEKTPPKIISARLNNSEVKGGQFLFEDQSERSNDSLVFLDKEKDREQPNDTPSNDVDSKIRAIQEYMSIIDDSQSKIRALLQEMNVQK